LVGLPGQVKDHNLEKLLSPRTGGRVQLWIDDLVVSKEKLFGFRCWNKQKSHHPKKRWHQSFYSNCTFKSNPFWLKRIFSLDLMFDLLILSENSAKTFKRPLTSWNNKFRSDFGLESLIKETNNQQSSYRIIFISRS
jgi:hypothetical protein